MKNRCCTTCRIYNWDYLMMLTLMLFCSNGMFQILNLMAIALFVRWEWKWRKYPERFLERTNQSLNCRRCEHPESCAGCVRKNRSRRKRTR